MSSEQQEVFAQALERARSALELNGDRGVEASRGALGELIEALGHGEATRRLPRAQALGTMWQQLGRSASDAARDVALLGERLEEALAERGHLTVDLLRDLGALVKHAMAEAVDAHAHAARESREGWLSFYAHELRNPLNTLVNSTWILRNHAATPQAQRVCDMADRAIQKMEGLIHDVRALERKATEEQPPRRKIL
jgi:signal transduction histidine kinase